MPTRPGLAGQNVTQAVVQRRQRPISACSARPSRGVALPSEDEVGDGVLKDVRVAALRERLVDPAHDLHVLLRNTRSPRRFHPSWVPPTAA